MSENENIDNLPGRDQMDVDIGDLTEPPGDLASIGGSVKNIKLPTSSTERQIKYERAQKCLENAALVSKRIKEHRKATAELLGKPFDEDVGDTASEMASTMSERTGYSVTSEKTTLSVQDALNIPGISESLANTLKQKELLMERIKHYKEISKRPAKKSTPMIIKDPVITTDYGTTEVKKQTPDNADVTKLVSMVKEKENALSVMQVKMRAMETTILDLQEKINEKDQIIDAKNKATTLISDNLSKKEKDSMALLEDTRQQMIKMQSNFAAMEAEWKEEKNRLLKQIDEKNEKINNLQEANTILENSRFEIGLSNSKLAEELELKNKEILELQEKIKDLSETNVQVSVQHKNEENVEEEKGTLEMSEMVELTKKIEILEQLNFQIRQTNKELENQLATITSESKPTATTTSSSSKKGSPVTNRKGGRNIKSKSPWRNLSSETLQDPERKTGKSDNSKIEMMLQSLNKDILEKEYLISQKDLLISQLESANIEKDATIAELRSCVDSKMKSPVQMVDVGTENIDSISRDYLCKNDVHIESSPEDTSTMNIKQLEERLKVAQAQIVTLNEEIDSANKNMVKVKSHSKLKFKQLQKTIDSFSKVSDANAEIVRLNDELHQLSQKVAELEEEKGNLQLHLVDYDSGRLTESDVYKKLVEIENLAEARLKSITLLETQKFDLVQELHVLQQKNIDLEDKLADMSQLQSEHVCSEIKSVQLEEQIDELIASKKELELVIQNLKLDMEQSLGSIKLLQAEKDELIHKLDNYIQENMELTDKLEKLSAEKVSSAESIEIVESLTTQEKLELEEYNKGLDKEKRSGEDCHENYQLDLRKNEENIQRLEKQSAELNEKVEMFTNERQEVMAKMISISSENESLHDKIEQLNSQCEKLRENINLLTEEKTCLQTLNLELNQQIEELKLERLEIMKETIEVVKPGSSLDDNVDLLMESHDEKSAGDKINNRSKSVKQLTKEILKLKNTIKEREAEIADCQMKILSLEENQEKQKELLQNSISYEEKLRQMLDENNQLKQEIDRINELQQERKNANDQHIQEGMQKLQQEYSLAISSRDTRIHELDNLLKEYEMQILNYVNTLQQKDKEINEYVNQITKLNDVSQKLKSTIELLEEEKAKDQNVELIKSLNKQISIYQKTLSEYEEKLKTLDEEKSQLSSLKALYENKNNALEADLKKMEESIKDKETIINDLKCQQQKHSEELSVVKTQAKQQDEEIHEIKLQLRKESIENEKLRTSLQQKDDEFIELKNSYEQFKAKIDASSIEHKNFSEQYAALENKNKELLEKLKKFAVNLKKKTTMYTDLENQFNDLQKEAESKSQELELLHKEKEMINVMQEQLKKAETQLGLLANEKSRMQEEITKLQNQLSDKSAEVHKLSGSVDMLTQSLDVLNKDFYFATDENANLKTQIESYKKKIAENEIEQKNNSNLLTKISCLEADINIKQSYIEELSSELKNQEDKFNQIQLGHGAKVQECELYIENLQAELEKYKNRIGRLEEAVSMMEESRNSLEHKADQLENQLQEKRQAYIQYSDQEDELVSRLAYLMDYDRVIEKQLYEIDMENQELQFKIQYLNEENTQLQNTYSDLQDYCKILELKAHKIDAMESDASTLESRVKDLESYVKKLTNENQTLMEAKKREMDELESEFNTQIENAIKEKKLLNEKCEKLCEREAQLLTQINEYHSNLESLKMNLKELSVENQKLLEKSTQKTNESVPDYTDQYISEINNLNSIINSKNEEIIDLSNKIQSLQSNNSFSLRDLDTQISKLTHDVQSSSDQINKYVAEIQSLKIANEDLSSRLVQKDDQIKQLLEKKKMFFEMNIPKTDGLTISSTIEDISDDQNISSISDLQSQIVTDTGEDYFDNASMSKETLEGLQSQQVYQASSSGEGVIEPLVVPKKSYLCYTKDEEKPEELDPFNSEEGWGVDVNEDTTDITPGVFHLNQKIQSLLEENQKLKSDLENTNAKLLKALKKLKELKSSNDMLTNELKISKQISQASILDMAIESEMNSNLEELEKKIQELKDDLNKEKREKESLRKQNEVFKNANDRLMEMKEKMDNEVELWKYNYKQINDKMSSLQWGAESKDNTNLQTSFPSIKCAERDDDIIKLEKENDELQTMLDNMNLQNTDLSKQLAQLKDELSYVKKELDTRQSVCEQCEKLKLELQELQSVKTDLHNQNMTLNKQSQEYRNQIEDAVKNINELKCSNEKQQQEFQQNERDLQKTILDLHETLKQHECDTLQKITSMNEELESVKLKLQTNDILSNEHASFEQKCISLRNELQNANEKNTILESRNDDLTKKIHENDKLVEDLNNKIKNLHYENDQLLSTVAELRASVSSAVDQRGYEIAELWKQHLNQREGEFQKIEEELRTQLKASDSKYEQLLDKMQSANKEDTDKIIVEQVMSLQNKIQEKEENLISLQGKYSDAICQLEMLRSEMEDEKLLHENKMLNSSAAQQKMYEELMNEVNLRNQKLLEEIENITQAHKTEISSNKLIIDNLNQQIEELRKSYEITVADLTKQIQIKEAEIYQKTNEFTNALAQRTEEFEVVRSQLLQYEKKIEDLEFEKESELAVLRLKIHDTVDSYERKKSKLEEEKNSLAEELNSKIVECTNLNKMITDLKASLEEYSVKAAEAQAVLENQEIEIVSLKEEISNLSDILKASNSKIEKHVTFATDTKPGFEGDKIESTLNKELLDAVPRAELDLALYMLHQRDVRCEELTMELTQLLEERDTLQLRLSDSLRSVEELRMKANLNLNISGEDIVSELPSTSLDKEHLMVDTHRPQTSRSSSISEHDVEKPKLQAKLSELRSVKHSRDVRLRHESESRQLGMRLLHRDVANLPPEAVDQLAQAHHTLTRDSQSTPTVLLNWLRGKSTPKVVHM